MKLRNIKTADIRFIARLHKKTINSPSSKIGIGYLTKIYQTLLKAPELHLCILAYDNDTIIGAITATKDLRKTNKLIKNFFYLGMIFSVIKAVLLGKVSIVELLNRIRFEQIVTNKFPQPYVTILTLFVAKSFQRKGIGRRLVREIILRLKNEKIKNVHVDTLTTNKKAIAFYQSIGFKRIEKIADSYVLEYKIQFKIQNAKIKKFNSKVISLGTNNFEFLLVLRP